jgi:hypothetical protein
VKLAFTLAFARDAASPHLGFAACQHHFPENFWNAAFQVHANGAQTVQGVVAVAENPSDHHVFLKAYTGLSDLHSSSIGVKARTEYGDIDIMEPTSFRDQFGLAVAADGEGMTLPALRFAVSDLARTEAFLRQAGIASQHHVGRLIVAPDMAHGATLVFEAS